jgi:hypothetical protein
MDAPPAIRHMIRGCLAILLLSPGIAAAAPVSNFTLIRDGKAHAVIVVADDANRNTKDAAAALQKVVTQMTGVQLAIKPASEFRDQAAPVFVGMSPPVRATGTEVPQDGDGEEQYVIRVDAKCIVLAGNDGGKFRGSVFAVYDLLQRLGCGWYGPDPIYHVIPRRAALSVEPVQSEERPAFRYRHIWMVKDPMLQDAWRLGGWHVTSGHAFERLVPAKEYAEAHPDYFGPGHKQPCLTHPEVLAIVVKYCREELDRKRGVLSFSLSSNDNKVFCECARCQAVGNISARMLNFANSVARELAKTHPNRYLLTFLAYWLAHDPPSPMLKAEPGVCVMQVNEGNHLRAWDQPEPKKYQTLESNDNNYREVTAFEGWRQTGAIMAIYEWWIPGCKKPEWQRVPWYSGETALRNLQYWKRNDVKSITYESGYEKGNGFPIRWPLYYVGARGLWNPELTSKQIMSEACAKLYGPAAQPMRRFYETIEKSTAEVPPTIRGYAWRLPEPQKIYLPPIEALATAALDEAASFKADADIQARIAQERAMWDNARTVLTTARADKKAKEKANDSYK